MSIDFDAAMFDDAIDPTDDRSGDLTFGVEMEFLVPYLGSADDDPHPLDTRPVFRLSEMPFFDELDDDIDEIMVRQLEECSGLPVRVELEDEFIPPHDNVPRYDSWRLIHETTLGWVFGGSGTYDYVGREITSEILRAGDLISEEKVRAMCRAVRRARVHLNDSCSVHVHVGHGTEGFTLLTIKKFASLIFLIDDLLMQLHHPARHESEYCKLVSKHSVLAFVQEEEKWIRGDGFLASEEEKADLGRHMPPLRDKNPALAAHMERIWSCSSSGELAHLTHTHPRFPWTSRGSVSFERFLPAGKTGGNTNTFEFRQMGGCLDPEHILAWVRVCVAIVDFARLSDAQQFLVFATYLLEALEGSYTSLDLLKDLNLPKEAEIFRCKMGSYKDGTGLAFVENGELFLPPL